MAKAARTRVLQLTVGFTVGGTELLIRDICRHIDRDRFDVEAACLKGPGPLGPEIARTGARVEALGGTRGFDPGLLWRLLGLLRRGRFDVLHSHLFLADLAARTVGRLARVPVVVHSQHDTDVWMTPRHILAARATLPLADRIAAVSHSVLDDTVRRLGVPGDRYMVIHNGIDLARFPQDRPPGEARRALGVKPDGPVIGFVGRLLDSKKGVSVLLEAFSRLVAEGRHEAALVIVGGGPDKDRLETMASRMGLDARVRFIGERADAAALYAGFDILAVPSYYEGFGLVCLEGMAAGLPVVASRVGGIPEIVCDDETGLLVPAGDPRALCRALAHYLADPERRALHGRAGRARVEARFTVERMVRAYEALYVELTVGAAARFTRRARVSGGER